MILFFKSSTDNLTQLNDGNFTIYKISYCNIVSLFIMIFFFINKDVDFKDSECKIGLHYIFQSIILTMLFINLMIIFDVSMNYDNDFMKVIFSLIIIAYLINIALSILFYVLYKDKTLEHYKFKIITRYIILSLYLLFNLYLLGYTNSTFHVLITILHIIILIIEIVITAKRYNLLDNITFFDMLPTFNFL